MHFVALTEYTAGDLRAEVEVDGPCLLADGTFALFVSLRGEDALLSPSLAGWPREVPARMRSEPVWIFLRRAENALCLGRAMFGPKRHGFKATFLLDEPLPEATWRALVEQATAPPPPPPEEALAELGLSSTGRERLAALEVFVARWHGPVVSRATSLLDRFRELAAPLVRHNALVAPEDVDGKRIFYVENQGVCTWALEGEGEDPPVVVRQNEYGAAWQRESPSLSAFLVGVALFEATLAAPHRAHTDALSASQLRGLQKKVPALAFAAWSASKVRFLAGHGVIGFAAPDADVFQVDLAARDEHAFDPLARSLATWPERPG